MATVQMQETTVKVVEIPTDFASWTGEVQIGQCRITITRVPGSEIRVGGSKFVKWRIFSVGDDFAAVHNQAQRLAGKLPILPGYRRDNQEGQTVAPPSGSKAAMLIDMIDVEMTPENSLLARLGAPEWMWRT